MGDRNFPRFPLDALVSLAFCALLLGACAALTWSPVGDAFRESGWFYPAWGLAGLLSLGALRGIGKIWGWLSFRPDPPLTWGEWFASLFTGRAIVYTVIGLAAIAAGLLVTKAMSIDPWVDYWRAQSWPESSCVIVEGDLYTSRGSQMWSKTHTYMRLAFTYDRDGKRHVQQTYSPWRAGRTEWLISPPREMVDGKPVDLNANFPLGSVQRCYIAPDARQAFLDRRLWSGGYAFAALGPALCVFGMLIIAARPRTTQS